MREKRLVLLLLATILIGGLLMCVTATVIKSLYNSAFDDFKGKGEYESWSVAEARRAAYWSRNWLPSQLY